MSKARDSGSAPKCVYVRLQRPSPDAPIYTEVNFTNDLKTFTVRQPKRRPKAVAEAAKEKGTLSRLSQDFSTAMMAFMVTAEKMVFFGRFISHMDISLELEPKLRSVGRSIKKRPSFEIFEVPEKYEYEVVRAIKRRTASVRFERQIPRMLISALIAQYDAFLSQLLEEIYRAKPELVSSLDKSLSLSDLMALGSIEEARKSVIESTVEGVLRGSHLEQLDWFAKHGIKIAESFDELPVFLEVCERRNLFTHTGGRVSSTYLRNCRKFGAGVSSLKVGDVLPSRPAYFRKAVDLAFELGFIALQKSWLKFFPDEIDVAEETANRIAYDLIVLRRYSLAAKILAFALKKPKFASDQVRRMMVVNRANAVKLAGDQAAACTLLDAEDWSASDRMFKINVAAVKDDVDECVSQMKLLGANDPMLDQAAYRSWPAFETVRKAPQFAEAFMEVFGEPLHMIVAGEDDAGTDSAGSDQATPNDVADNEEGQAVE